MLAELTDKPFDGGREWLFEVKWDGERAIAQISNFKYQISNKSQIQNFKFQTGKYIIYSRYNKDLTKKYPELKEITKLVKAKSATFDGEICVLDTKGVSKFELLQQRIGLSDPATIRERMQKFPAHFFIFDIIELDGKMLTDLSLVERKKILKKVLSEGGNIHLTEYQIGKGKLYFEAAKKLGLEGVMAKYGNSKYEMGRSRNWLKVKITNQQEFVIGGWTEGRGAREGTFGSLLIGFYDKSRRSLREVGIPTSDVAKQIGTSGLKFAGHVGTGFNEEMIDQLFVQLKRIETKVCPFELCPKTNEIAHWVKPTLVCEIRFAEWTSKGILRQPVYLGLRDDKKAEEVVREK